MKKQQLILFSLKDLHQILVDSNALASSKEKNMAEIFYSSG